MRALNFLMPLLAFSLSCTKPKLPEVQEKDDEQKTEVEQPATPDSGEDNSQDSNINTMTIIAVR